MNITIRKAEPKDVYDLKELYFVYLTQYPPTEEQDMLKWEQLVTEFADSDNIHLLVCEVNGKVVSTVHLNIIKNLTHNLRPYGVIENVVTHGNYQNKGYASALLQAATRIAKEKNCYKIMLETGSNKESTLNFYRKKVLLSTRSIRV